ncbi:MAG: folate-binding protein [Pseudomonadota bacterium]
MHAHLSDRAVLAIRGDDAIDFLSGLVTADVAGLTDGGSSHAGLLTPQGKILFEFIVHRAGDALMVDVAQSQAEALAKRLGFYKLRAAVEIEPLGDHAVVASWGADVDVSVGPADPRLSALGHRGIVAREGLPDDPSALDAYNAFRVGHAVPEGGTDYALGETFPHDACFDLLGGVNFSKGCYVGQEVVSRMRHRGTARRRVLGVQADGDRLPGQGAEILAGERPVATLGTSAEGRGIAIARIDRVRDALADGVPIMCEGEKLHLAAPAWANYSLDQDTESAAS